MLEPLKNELNSKKLCAFLHDENGPTVVEYAVMVALIIVVSIAAITTLGTKVSGTFSNTANNVTAGIAAIYFD